MYQWHLAASAWSDFYLVEKGKEKMGVRAVRGRKYGLLLPRLLYWGSDLTSISELDCSSLSLNCLLYYYQGQDSALGKSPSSHATLCHPLPSSHVSPESTCPVACPTFGSISEIYLPKSLWESVHSPLKWAWVRSRRRNQGMACSLPMLWCCHPTGGKIRQLRTVSEVSGPPVQCKTTGKAGFSSAWVFSKFEVLNSKCHCPLALKRLACVQKYCSPVAPPAVGRLKPDRLRQRGICLLIFISQCHFS